MANRSKTRSRAASRGGKSALKGAAPSASRGAKVHSAQGRLGHGPPLGVIDIGSNSVRLVVYEELSRSPTPIFNEKVLAGLGREVQTKGVLAEDAMDKAYGALRRFRSLCQTMRVSKVLAIATAACRDARNGAAFVSEAERICGAQIQVLSGREEAKYTALGVLSGVHKPDGIVGDLGGGSLELVDIHGARVKTGETLPLGGLALQDLSGKSIKKAERLVRSALGSTGILRGARGRTFYAVGGTWRSLARLHMWQTGYPLHVMHGYVLNAREAAEYCRLVHRVDPESLSQIEVVAKDRRPLLPYAALVLEMLLAEAKPKQVVISAMGVREGLLYSMLDAEQRREDALIAAAGDLNVLRSRSPRHGEELVEWTDKFMSSTGLDEPAEEKRLRHAACLLADIGWRAHPDYRGEQSLNIIAHAGFVGLDHPGRAFLALAVYFRHVGLIDDELSPRLRELASARILDRARVLGAAMRVAYLISAAMPGVLPRAPMQVVGRRLVLRLEGKYAPLASERVLARLRQLGRLIGREPDLVTG